jgi:dephospho-CoA kinase
VRTYGLTGGIATGKSTVEAVLRGLGVPTFDADQYARRVVEPGQPAYREIVAAFGEGVLQPDGAIDRAALGRVVFRDAAARAHLEQITHPRIMGTIFDEAARLGEQGEPMVVASAALLYEAKFQHRFDGVVVVWCEPDEQLRRIMERDRFTAEQARRRIEAQMPINDKVALADWVIDSNGSKDATAAQVADLVRVWRD